MKKLYKWWSKRMCLRRLHLWRYAIGVDIAGDNRDYSAEITIRTCRVCGNKQIVKEKLWQKD